MNATVATYVSKLSDADLQMVATQGFMDNDADLSKSVLVHCMYELAHRYDRESFASICSEVLSRSGLVA